MGRRKKALTDEQIEFRNSILKGRIGSIKSIEKIDRPITTEEKLKQCFYYLNNCIYWVNQFIDGKVDHQDLLKTAGHIKEHATKIESIIKQNTNISIS